MNNKTLIIICGVVIALPVIYYFCYALPQHNKALQEIELQKLEYQKEQDRLAEEKKANEKREAELKKEQEQERKERDYENCMSNAEKNYYSTWNNNCKQIYDSQNAQYQKCLTDTEDYNRKYPQEAYPDHRCDNLIPNTKQSDCMLPTATADYINKQYSEEKDRCFSVYRA